MSLTQIDAVALQINAIFINICPILPHMKALISTNPAKNYEKIGEVSISTDAEIKEKVKCANEAKAMWKDIGVKERVRFLRPAYEQFSKRKKEISTLITKEIGKAVKDSEKEMDFYLNYFKWFLENGENALQDEVTLKNEKSVHKIVYEPYGVAAVITPWNLPFGIFVWGVIPNLIAGNTVVFKISEECPLTGKLMEEIMLSQNIPEGVFSEIYGDGKTGRKLIQSEINLIWFTGSTEVGKELYRIAANKFIKAVLEMGGSNPAIIFKDADIDRFIEKIYSKRFIASGQTCDALKRLIVHKSVFDEVIQKLKNKIESKIVGSPENSETDIGSIVSKKQLRTLEAQVTDAVKSGAKVVTGGKTPDDLKGAFYLPTLLTNVTQNMRVWNEEIFGPVLSVIAFETEEEAIRLANDSKYGLGAIVFTKDGNRAERVASKIDAGTIEINAGNHWMPCNPFGGYKLSGIGREHGTQGFRELCQIKVISKE